MKGLNTTVVAAIVMSFMTGSALASRWPECDPNIRMIGLPEELYGSGRQKCIKEKIVAAFGQMPHFIKAPKERAKEFVEAGLLSAAPPTHDVSIATSGGLAMVFSNVIDPGSVPQRMAGGSMDGMKELSMTTNEMGNSGIVPRADHAHGLDASLLSGYKPVALESRRVGAHQHFYLVEFDC